MSINNRKSRENTADFFNDDFEVVYQEEEYSNFLRNELNDESTDDPYDSEYENERYGTEYNNRRRDTDYGGRSRRRSYDRRSYDRYEDIDYDDEDYNYDYDYDYDDNRRSRYKKRLLSPDLISPASKTAATSIRFIYRLISLLLRSATLILIGIITYTLAVNFWENHREYGDIIHAVLEKNYILAAYAAVAAFLLLFQLFSFLFVLATSRRTDYRGRKVDTGSGLFSFVFIYAGSYLAFFFHSLVPVSPSPLLGIQGALKVYGSMRSVLLPLCIAGIISCLVRKFAVR